jgi:hypothetical protein
VCVCVCVCVWVYMWLISFTTPAYNIFFLFFSAFLFTFDRIHVSRSLPSRPLPTFPSFSCFLSPFLFFPNSPLPLFLNFSLCLSHSFLSLSLSSLYPTIYFSSLLYSSLLFSPPLPSPPSPLLCFLTCSKPYSTQYYLGCRRFG